MGYDRRPYFRPFAEFCAPSMKPVVKGPLHYANLTDVARLIELGEISPVELTEMMLGRIAAVDGHLKSYATVTAERALDAARKAEHEISSGNYYGPLHGIPIAVKDLCFTKGTRTMGGLAVLRDFVPEYDATVVSRLDQAGAVLLGKLNLTEGAMAGYLPARNPGSRNTTRWYRWAGYTSSAPSITTPGASTTSSEAGPGVRATRAAPSSISPWKTN